MTFELESVDDTTAEMVDGHVWVEDTTTTGDYTFRRHIFPLPDDAKKVELVQVMQSTCELAYLQPFAFDAERLAAPTLTGAEPRVYTLRANNIEVWPLAGDTYVTLLLTYLRQAPTYTTDDVGTTVADWREEWSDLLFAAIRLEAAITQGKNSPCPYQIALHEYDAMLKEYKSEDSGLPDLGGPMGVRVLDLPVYDQRLVDWNARIT